MSKMDRDRTVIRQPAAIRGLNVDLAKAGLPIIIAVFIFIVAIKLLMSFNFYAPHIVPDEYIYSNYAYALSAGNLYPSMGSIPPLYPLILSLSCHVSSDKVVVYHVMLGMSCFITSSIIFPAFFILRKYVKPVHAILGAIAVASFAALNYFSFSLMLENLFIPLLLFSIWAIIEAFDTNEISWQIIAGISIACLEITRSLGQLIEYSFVLAFVLFLLINRKEGILKIVKNKASILLSFATIFGLWHVFLQMTSNMSVPGIGGNTGNIGGSFSVLNWLSGLTFIFHSQTNFILTVKIFLNHIDYVILALYLLPVFVLFYLVLNRNEIKPINPGHQFGVIFILLSAAVMIVCVTIIDLLMINGISEIHYSLGRYLDPLLPPLFIFGLISICKVNSTEIKKNHVRNLIFIELAALAIVYASTYTFNLSFDSSDYANNTSLTYLFITNYWVYPLVIITIVVLSTLVLYLATIDKRFIPVLLLFIIAVSIISSCIAYNLLVNGSEVMLKNDISQYVYDHSNGKTMILVDQNLTGREKANAVYIYNFWNYGESSLIDINDTNLSLKMSENNVYLLTTANLTYIQIATDNRIKLYGASG